MVEEFDHKRTSLDTYLSINNEAIFNGLVIFTYNLLKQHPGKSIAEYARLWCIPKRNVRYRASWGTDCRDDIKPEIERTLYGLHGGTPDKDLPGFGHIPTNGQEVDFANQFYKATGRFRNKSGDEILSMLGLKPDQNHSQRKLYLCPDLNGLAQFVEMLYIALEQNNAGIYQAKSHLDNCEVDEEGMFQEQGHNTVVLYPYDDQEIAGVLESIEQAKIMSGVLLQKYNIDEVAKTVPILGGEVLLGVDLRLPRIQAQGNSFDVWTARYLLLPALRTVRANPHFTIHDISQAMQQGLAKSPIPRDPNTFLSLLSE